MTTTILTTPSALKPRRLIVRAWRKWWLRAAKRRQMRQLDRVLLDPHMARDLGLPVQAPQPTNLDLM